VDFSDNIVEREQAIYKAGLEGRFQIEWANVTSSIPGYDAVFMVTRDAVKIDGVRFNVSAYLLQTLCDYLGSMMLTPKIADLMWAQRAVTLTPHPRPITSSTAGMLAHSGDIDRELQKLGGASEGIINTVGKYWTLSNGMLQNPGRAENYGWHFIGSNFQGLTGEPCVSIPGQRLIQGRGWAHDARHTDYSQICTMMSVGCFVNGEPMDVRDVLQNPDMAGLANHDGVLRVLRQPGVDESSITDPIAKNEVDEGPFARGTMAAEFASILPGGSADPKGTLSVLGPLAAGAVIGWISANAVIELGEYGRRPRRAR